MKHEEFLNVLKTNYGSSIEKEDINSIVRLIDEHDKAKIIAESKVFIDFLIESQFQSWKDKSVPHWFVQSGDIKTDFRDVDPSNDLFYVKKENGFIRVTPITAESLEAYTFPPTSEPLN